jgi:hypothetical protein
MRRILLTVAMLAVCGCASSTRQERHERIARWFKEWWDSPEPCQDSGLLGAQGERYLVKSLNDSIGNNSEAVDRPRGR